MKEKYLFVLCAVVVVLANTIGIVQEDFWLKQLSQFFFFFSVTGFYFSRLSFRNFNFLIFFILFSTSGCVSFFANTWYFEQIGLGLLMAAYFFLVREAIKHTVHEKGSKFTTLYFLGIMGGYIYLLFLHISEIERSLDNSAVLSLYIVYYLNILVFAGAALIYYLNSFSRKAVFFVALTLGFVFSDVLREMELFYFRDLSVELASSLIRFAAIPLVFQFFVTPEKKLRLLHLV